MTIENNKYERGSEWRKWDLHIHTPKTKLSDHFEKIEDEDIWKTFCTKIEESDVSVFGITDYFSVENYFTFIRKHKQYFPLSEKVFFPNIELRLEVSVNKGAEEVNIHIIFSNSELITKSKIEEFLLKLDTNIKFNEAVISCKNLTTKNDFEKAGVKHDVIRKKLKEVFGKDECYLIIAASNNAGLRADTSSPRKLNVSDEIDKVCDGFFGGKQNIKYYLDVERYETEEKAKAKPVISACDAHSFDDIDNYLGKKFIKKNKRTNKDETIKNITWIKADPTFEGLKQIMYEPELRISFSIDNPEKKSNYQVIDRLEINYKNIFNKSIKLNSYLNSIIGGRSTGKSILLASIAKKIKTDEPVVFENKKRYDSFINEITESLKIHWKDGVENNDREVEYFHQGYMYDIARDDNKKDRLIQKILKNKGKESILYNYEKSISENKKKISNLVNDFFQLRNEINEKELKVRDKGDKKGI
jgi:exonuclease SbcC